MTTRIDIINSALVRIGSDPLQSEATDGAETHLKIYDGLTDFILSSHTWAFAKFTRKLARLTDPPGQHWKYAFKLPSEMVGQIRAAFDQGDCRDPFTSYELMEEKELHANVPDVWAQGTKRQSPVHWPGYFREFMTQCCMAEFAGSVREDWALREKMRTGLYGPPEYQGQGGLFALCKSQNDMGNPSAVVGTSQSPLILARR